MRRQQSSILLIVLLTNKYDPLAFLPYATGANHIAIRHSTV
jgi:hypothetical protein